MSKLTKQELKNEVLNLDGVSYGYPNNYVSRDSVLKLIERLEKSDPVELPDFVTEYLDYMKSKQFSLFEAMEIDIDKVKFELWEYFFECGNETAKEREELFARAWIYGYVGKQNKYCKTASYLEIFRYFQQIELDVLEVRKGVWLTPLELLNEQHRNTAKRITMIHRDLDNYLNPGNIRHVVYTLYTEEGLTPKEFGEKINHTEKDIIDLVTMGIVTSDLLDAICDYYGLLKTSSFTRYVN